MLFYIVKHATFENENVIFTDEVSAINYIKKRKKELIELGEDDEIYQLFKIVTVTEGERFDAFIQI